GGNTFSPVIAMLHCSPGVSSRFLSIAHEGGFLAISLDHLLWAKRGSDWKWVAAKHLQPNDIVSCRGQHSAVLGVKLEEAAGVFAPLTTSGRLLVEGVLCSCYAPPEELRLSHGLCHLAMAPLRWATCARTAVEAFTTFNESKPVLTLDALWLLPYGNKALHPYAAALLAGAKLALG
ncbi:unnamed protein product, partial [Effrenium voratum]